MAYHQLAPKRPIDYKQPTPTSGYPQIIPHLQLLQLCRSFEVSSPAEWWQDYIRRDMASDMDLVQESPKSSVDFDPSPSDKQHSQ